MKGIPESGRSPTVDTDRRFPMRTEINPNNNDDYSAQPYQRECFHSMAVRPEVYAKLLKGGE
jgi:hypothetical protein